MKISHFYSNFKKYCFFKRDKILGTLQKKIKDWHRDKILENFLFRRTVWFILSEIQYLLTVRDKSEDRIDNPGHSSPSADILRVTVTQFSLLCLKMEYLAYQPFYFTNKKLGIRSGVQKLHVHGCWVFLLPHKSVNYCV